MRTTFFFALFLFSMSCFPTLAAPSQTTREMLHSPTEIRGDPCAKDYAWFYAEGRLQRCFVSRDTAFGEIIVPTGSIINLLPDGRPEYAMLAHDTPLLGMNCSGGSLVGPAEGAVTDLYPSGKLHLCYLARDHEVQGVPCGSGGFLNAIAGHDVAVELYETGKLKSCRLTANYQGRHRNDRFTQGP